MKTFEQILNFNQTAFSITEKHGTDPKNKFLYAILKNQKKTDKLIADYNKWQRDFHLDKSEDLKIELASVDEKGNVIQDSEGKFSYTKENMKKLTKELKNLQEKLVERLETYKQREFEIEPYITTDADNDIVKSLSEEEVEALTGFVLPEKSIENE